MKLISFTDRYWKGDGLFLDISDFPHRKKSKEVYESLESGDAISLRNFSFFRKHSPEIYELLKRAINFKGELGQDDFLSLIRYFMRARLFSIDFLEKQSDDLELKEDSERLAKHMLGAKNFFMPGANLEIDLENLWELIPQRNTSELMYYIITFYCNLRRAKKICSKSKKFKVDIEEKDTFLITHLTCESQESSEIKDDPSMESILSNLFGVANYKGYNYGAINSDDTSNFWFAWLA